MDDDEFDRRVAAGDFLEHAGYASNRYGTLRSEVEPRLARGASVVLEIEVQGARQVRETMPEAVQVFIAPPSPADLRARLEGRGTDSPEQIAQPPGGGGRGARGARRVRPRGRQRRRRRAAEELTKLVRSTLGESS